MKCAPMKANLAPSRTRYTIVMLAIGLAIISYVQRVAISVAAGPIARDLHIPKEQMGLIFGAFGLSYALFEIPMGLLGDRLGVRRVLAQIVLAWSAFTALTGAAWNVASLYVIRFLFGAGEAGCFPNLTRMLSVWLPARERVKAQALMWAFTRWGGAATPPLALLCITWFGWRWAFVGFAVLGLAWCAVFLFWFRNDPAEHPRGECRRKRNAAGIAYAYHSSGRTTTLDLPAADKKSIDARSAVFLLFLCVVLLHHVAADVFARRPWTVSGPRGSSCGIASFVRRIRFADYGTCARAAVATSHCIFWFSRNGHPVGCLDAYSRGGSGHAGHGTRQLLQRSDDADFLGHLRGNRWPIYRDGRRRNEHAGQPRGLCSARGWRSDPSEDRRQLEHPDLHDGRSGDRIRCLLAFP